MDSKKLFTFAKSEFLEYCGEDFIEEIHYLFILACDLLVHIDQKMFIKTLNNSLILLILILNKILRILNMTITLNKFR